MHIKDNEWTMKADFNKSQRSLDEVWEWSHTNKLSQPDPLLSTNTSSPELRLGPLFALASKKIRFSAAPKGFAKLWSSQSLVSISSDSQSKKSKGFRYAFIRSSSGLLRTSRGIVALFLISRYARRTIVVVLLPVQVVSSCCVLFTHSLELGDLTRVRQH